MGTIAWRKKRGKRKSGFDESNPSESSLSLGGIALGEGREREKISEKELLPRRRF